MNRRKRRAVGSLDPAVGIAAPVRGGGVDGEVLADVRVEGSGDGGAVPASAAVAAPPAEADGGAVAADGSAAGGAAAAAPEEDDGPVSEVLRVHKAIRMELDSVLARVDQLPCGDGLATAANPLEVTALAERVSFLRRMVQEHSKAEDNVVLPKLEERVHGLVEKYSNEHVVERGLFKELSELFVRLQCLPSAVESEHLIQSIRTVTRALRDSMFAHLGEEEAQLWPLLVTHFTKDEAAEIVARIFGTMPAEHLQEMLPWMVRVLSASEQAEMMSHIFQVTRSTMFETWLKSWFRMPADISASPVSTGGAASEEARGASCGGGGGGSGAAASSAGGRGSPAGGGRASHGAQVSVVASSSGDSPTYRPNAGPVAGAGGAAISSPRPTSTILYDTETASAAAALVLLKGKVNMEAAIREIGRDASLTVEARSRMIHQLLLAPWVQTTAAAARSKDAARDAADGRYAIGAGGNAGAASGAPADTSADGGGGVAGVAAAATAGTAAGRQWPVTRGLVLRGSARADGAIQGATALTAGASADDPLAVAPDSKVVPGLVRAPTPREIQPVFRTLPDGRRVRGCQHYQRAAKLRAKCCDRIYPCRLCHDAECGHTMDRPAVEEMLCTYCGTVQPVAGKCAVAACGRLLARYYCSVCKYFDDDTSRSIYHCHSCNVCRVGKGLGIDFFHCMKCNACMNMKYAREHRCVERALESDCPVCHHFLFTSTSPVKYLRCGHLMHVSCYQQYAQTSYSCPICSKSLADMSAYFERLDYLLAGEQMPAEYRSARADVWCNDCSKPSLVPYHFLYNRCAHCRSYNTRVNSVDPNGGRAREAPPGRGGVDGAGMARRLPVVPARLVGAPPPRGLGVPLPRGIGAPPQRGIGAPPQRGIGAPPPRGFGAPPPRGFGTPPPRGFGAPPPRGFGVPASSPAAAAAAAAAASGARRNDLSRLSTAAVGTDAHHALAAATSPVASPAVSPALSSTSVPPAAAAEMATMASAPTSTPAVAARWGATLAPAARATTLNGRKRARR
ncbi:hypothetical protein BU14_0219s0008 [Porphyra umbilicalis]|uniref:CHY-type domain-containing protein n=1 Tax=Porphyra umbilicalis TaxID=2786 RepID=A0A1X6P4N7_PORUM|nr:hypothetical protein BU14_0219s0008 [Porphyra umbilicalis]|eukprot:OSX75808.1 hypothetical protein BU14_0219s0008 [Porphyra umbilicalis]